MPSVYPNSTPTTEDQTAAVTLDMIEAALVVTGLEELAITLTNALDFDMARHALNLATKLEAHFQDVFHASH